MIQTFFTALLAIVGILSSIYSYFYDRKDMPFLFLMFLFSLFCVYYWQASIIFLVGFLFYKKLGFGYFVGLNMFTAVTLSYFFFNLFLTVASPYYFYVALITVIAICGLAIFGIFEDELKKFLLISSGIQITFVVLDLSVAKILGELSILGTVQIFNYVFAGLALFLTLGVFARDKKFISELQGSYFASRLNDIFATVACLSLAGLPAFNMFVSEWALFTEGFKVSPIITILGIFAALLLFIMYYKIVYVLLVGEGYEAKYAPKPITFINGMLALFCVVFGLLPQVQWFILSKVM